VSIFILAFRAIRGHFSPVPAARPRTTGFLWKIGGIGCADLNAEENKGRNFSPRMARMARTSPRAWASLACPQFCAFASRALGRFALAGASAELRKYGDSWLQRQEAIHPPLRAGGVVEDTRPGRMVARQRIACEIGSHYADAVGVHLAEGEPESSAQAKALAELGDPQKMAQKFRQSHLTVREARSLKWMESTAAKPVFSLWGLLLDGMPVAVASLGFAYSHGDPELVCGIHLYAGGVLVIYAGCRLIPRLPCAAGPSRRALLRQLSLCQLTTQVAVVPSVFLFSDFQQPFIRNHE
jgi:hypothetical protein